MILASASGEREVPLDAFVTGYRQTVRRTDELIIAVRVPLPAPNTRQAFFKAGTRRAQSIARVSVAGAARVTAAGALRAVRLAAGSVAPVPILLSETMRLLEGCLLDAAFIDRADRLAASEITPIEDVRSDIAYRRFVTGRLVARFLRDYCRP
jgi:CO/xanthine dehydrogenase FAD-binding subunit